VKLQLFQRNFGIFFPLRTLPDDGQVRLGEVDMGCGDFGYYKSVHYERRPSLAEISSSRGFGSGLTNI